MTMRRAGGLALAAILAAALAGGCGSPPSSSHDLLLLSVDTLRPDHLGCYGMPDARTPFWDRLARRGLQFADAMSAAPLTLPSHSTMLTGQYPPVHLGRRNGSEIDPPGGTIAETLTAVGFRCGAVVASVVLDPRKGLDRGFESYTYADPGGRIQRTAPGVIDDAVAWLRTVDPAERFFAFVHLYDPHGPYEPPASWRRVYPGRPYDGEIAFADRELVRLWRELERLDRLEGLLLVATSDHGEAFGEHEETGHGFFVYATTVRVPLIIDGLGAPRVRADLARTVDIHPTALAALGVVPPIPSPGRDLREAGPASTEASTEAYAETFSPAMDFGASDLRTLRAGRWKYIRAPREELYDLDADPGETVNLFAEDTERAEDLADDLAAMLGDDLVRPAGLAEAAPLDPEEAEKLRALGYLSGEALPGLEDFRALRDPKDLAGIPERLDRAEEAAGRRRWDEMRAVLAEVLAKDPTNPTANRLLAREQFEEGREAAGFAVYERVLKEHEEDPRLWREYGDDLLLKGRAEQARDALRTSVQLNPRDLEAQTALAQALLRTGDAEGARTAIDHVLSVDPESRPAQNVRREIDRMEERGN